MHITASILNTGQSNEITVATNENCKEIVIPSKQEGNGSSINGGELLLLALATCFCNDIYREGSKRRMNIHSVKVLVSGNFGKEGEPASNILYETEIQADATAQEIDDLVAYVDRVAEVHNTLRAGTDVRLKIFGASGS